ncbi:YhcH/YjgK/YiaL family protein [Butyrivibrio sp. XPD2006]|uniref:YhcH/YjgK/YiaL family protein n=1 Tax=Butyrivibrio sp. XPD2006 TaxID=1280668 RepID=UPI0003B54907|nr:YhcH/YjgK/YiaL family protein [Butyrivibrio sp. XPD2006]
MILDRIENIGTYLGISRHLDIAIKEIQKGHYKNWDIGRHEIEGNNVFCNRVYLETKEENSWERHEEYLDIHIVIDGSEVIRYSECSYVNDWGEFDAKGDCALAPFSDTGIDLRINPGWFLIVFPQDAHMPGLRDDGEFSDKAIFKVCVKGK